MDLPALYDEDLYAWSLAQAAVLRRMAAEGHDRLPNDLDVENVAEEIEDVARSKLSAVESHLARMLEHVLKAASSPGAQPAAMWLDEVMREQADAVGDFSRSMRRKLELQPIWRTAVRFAGSSLRRHGEVLLPVSDDCPFTLDELLDTSTPPEDFVARLVPRPPPAGP